MKKLLVLGSDRGAVYIVQYAKSKDIYTIVTDYYEIEESEAKKLADESWMISTSNIDELEKRSIESGVTGVICGASDFNTENVMKLCKRLKLPCYCSKEAWRYSIDKSEFKELCKSVGALVATDYYITDEFKEEEFENIQYPVVVKPIDLTANRGVSFCYNKEEVIAAYKYAKSLTKSNKVIVEQMIDGAEVVGLYAMSGGEISLLEAFVAKNPENSPFYCYSIGITAPKVLKKFYKDVNPEIEKLLKRARCKEGYAFVQTIFGKDEKFYLIEMGHRINGDLTGFPLKELIGFDVAGWMVDYALGEKNILFKREFDKVCDQVRCACSYMIWTNKDGKIMRVEGLKEIQKELPVSVDVSHVVAEDSVYRAIGGITFVAKNYEELCEILQQINKKVKIIDKDGNDIFLRYEKYDSLEELLK